MALLAFNFSIIDLSILPTLWCNDHMKDEWDFLYLFHMLTSKHTHTHTLLGVFVLNLPLVVVKDLLNTVHLHTWTNRLEKFVCTNRIDSITN